MGPVGRGIQDALRLIRWPNVVMIVLLMEGIRVFFIAPVEAHFGLKASLTHLEWMLLTFDVVWVAVIGYVMNDLADLQVDRVNKPKRPLASGSVSMAQAVQFRNGAIVFGALLTVWLGYTTQHLEWVWLYPFSLVVLYFYARNGKRWGYVGNLTVSAMIAFIPGLPLLAEWQWLSHLHAIDASWMLPFVHLFALNAALMLLANVSRELVKDLEDVEGDRQAASKSLAIHWGIEPTKKLVLMHLAAMCLVEAGFIRLLPNDAPSWMLVGVLETLLVFVAFKLMNSTEKLAFSRISLWLKGIMLLGLFQLFFASLRLS
jgi:4-hydroxybenzoate polyprenyltransferase